MQPREKLLKYWERKLEWWELVAVILWSWVKWQKISTLSKKVFKIIEKKAEKIEIKDLLEVRWIWKVKAIQIVSAFELANRYFIKDFIFINSVQDVLNQVNQYRDKKQEYLLSLTLDWANRLINTEIITIWLLNESLIHPREVFIKAIEDRANSIILVHNHPSWINKPSQADLNSTYRIKEVADLVGIKLRDHVIITKSNHYSFVENNLL